MTSRTIKVSHGRQNRSKEGYPNRLHTQTILIHQPWPHLGTQLPILQYPPLVQTRNPRVYVYTLEKKNTTISTIFLTGRHPHPDTSPLRPETNECE